jgi:hypothetical protein
MTDNDAIELPGRRRFLMLMGLACATSTLARPVALAEAVPGAAAPATPAKGAPAAADSSSAHVAPKPPSDEARALAEVVRLRHGAHLTEAELRAVAEDLDGRLEGGRNLRKLTLANGDEPDVTFHA